jgi:KaiC/GvpD/RAD55 family RecA-like ATPase
MEVKRCPTGIEGLDELIEGGIPQGRTVLLAGGCGTGKSILGTQFLYNGIVKYGEPGIFVTLEQHPSRIREDMMLMGFDLKELEDRGSLQIIDASLSDTTFTQRSSEYTLSAGASFSLDSVIGFIEDAMRKTNAKRVVVDSISALDSLMETKKVHSTPYSPNEARRILLGINYKLQYMGLTSILISDILENEMTSKYGVEEFVVDGVISLHYNVFGPDAGRHLIIKKMRRTKHSENIHTIEFIRGEGIRVKGV